MRATFTFALLAAAIAIVAAPGFAGLSTSLTVSAELGTSIAREQFPVTVALPNAKLFLTEPKLIFIDQQRVGIKMRFQAYDHRPEQGIAISETGSAALSGELDYDSAARKVLLHKPRVDALQFDRKSPNARTLQQTLQAAWSTQITDPLRADLPQHPYLLPFRDNIENLSFDGENIVIYVNYR